MAVFLLVNTLVLLLLGNVLAAPKSTRRLDEQRRREQQQAIFQQQQLRDANFSEFLADLSHRLQFLAQIYGGKSPSNASTVQHQMSIMKDLKNVLLISEGRWNATRPLHHSKEQSYQAVMYVVAILFAYGCAICAMVLFNYSERRSTQKYEAYYNDYVKRQNFMYEYLKVKYRNHTPTRCASKQGISPSENDPKEIQEIQPGIDEAGGETAGSSTTSISTQQRHQSLSTEPGGSPKRMSQRTSIVSASCGGSPTRKLARGDRLSLHLPLCETSSDDQSPFTLTMPPVTLTQATPTTGEAPPHLPLLGYYSSDVAIGPYSSDADQPGEQYGGSGTVFNCPQSAPQTRRHQVIGKTSSGGTRSVYSLLGTSFAEEDIQSTEM